MTSRWTTLVAASLATLLLHSAPTSPVRADIFKWEYINPANPSLGKQPSSMLAPDGAGVMAEPGANLSNRNLTMAYLIGADLSAYPIYDVYGYEIGYVGANLSGANLSQADLANASLFRATLAGANLSQANLRGASFWGAYLTGANLSGAEVQGANFRAYGVDGATGITAAQLSSTASYQAHDLTGITLADLNLAGVDLAGQNLTNATFYYATLTNANLSQAILANARFDEATLTGANLSGADVRMASLVNTGITAGQIYSTASYLAHDLTGIGLGGNNLAGVNLVGQNLTDARIAGAFSNANFSQANLTRANISYSNLTSANFSQANLTNADVSHSTLTGASLTGAEVRGTNFHAATITPAQLASTASYQAHDLTGIVLSGTNLAGANLASQNLTNANLFLTTLSNANLSQANLTNAVLTGATLTGANLSGAQVRGTDFSAYYDGYDFYRTISLGQLYSTASYQAHDLTGIKVKDSNFAGANLVGQNLSDANFQDTVLTGANLAGADVRGADFRAFYSNGGISIAQLYSTASYQAHNFSGIGLSADLSGANLAGQNLSNAKFHLATLTGANLSQADLTNVAFESADLTGANLSHANFTKANFVGDYFSANLTNADLSQANLTNANLSSANLTGANLAGTEVRGANFSHKINDYYGASSRISLGQLYSTASYQAHDLSGLVLSGNNLAGVDFAGQNLTNANFDGDGNWDYESADLSGANLSGADARGANFYYATLTGANTSNLIQSNGHIAGVDLTSGASLVVRDYNGNPAAAPPTGPLPIVVEQHLAMDATGALRLVFNADHWDSTISFAPGIPVALGGTLDLSFADGVSVASQIGRTFDVFNWSGVDPTGFFSISSPYAWNLSNLYSSGKVTLAANADTNGDGLVDISDVQLIALNWLRQGPLGRPGDANYSGLVDISDIQTVAANWMMNWPPGGQGARAQRVPEPSTFALAGLGILGLIVFRKHRQSIGEDVLQPPVSLRRIATAGVKRMAAADASDAPQAAADDAVLAHRGETHHDASDYVAVGSMGCHLAQHSGGAHSAACGRNQRGGKRRCATVVWWFVKAIRSTGDATP